MGSLTHRQKTLTKGHLIDSKIKSYGIFLSFSPLDPEFTPGHRCYESMLKGLGKEATLVLSNTRELDRVSSTE